MSSLKKVLFKLLAKQSTCQFIFSSSAEYSETCFVSVDYSAIIHHITASCLFSQNKVGFAHWFRSTGSPCSRSRLRAAWVTVLQQPWLGLPEEWCTWANLAWPSFDSWCREALVIVQPVILRNAFLVETKLTFLCRCMRRGCQVSRVISFPK